MYPIPLLSTFKTFLDRLDRIKVILPVNPLGTVIVSLGV